MKLDFAYIGHPVLREKASLITKIDASVVMLIENMKESVESRRGLGLAAPQVGVSLSIFIACFPIEGSSEEIKPGPVKVFINPVLTNPSTESWVHEEGCLSLPKLFADVSRPTSVTITYQDEFGATHTDNLSGWPARIVMHENDHLNGTLFIDRLSSKDKHKFAKKIEQLKQQYKKHNAQLQPPLLTQ